MIAAVLILAFGQMPPGPPFYAPVSPFGFFWDQHYNESVDAGVWARSYCIYGGGCIRNFADAGGIEFDAGSLGPYTVDGGGPYDFVGLGISSGGVQSSGDVCTTVNGAEQCLSDAGDGIVDGPWLYDGGNGFQNSFQVGESPGVFIDDGGNVDISGIFTEELAGDGVDSGFVFQTSEQMADPNGYAVLWGACNGPCADAGNGSNGVYGPYVVSFTPEGDIIQNVSFLGGDIAQPCITVDTVDAGSTIISACYGPDCTTLTLGDYNPRDAGWLVRAYNHDSPYRNSDYPLADDPVWTLSVQGIHTATDFCTTTGTCLSGGMVKIGEYVFTNSTTHSVTISAIPSNFRSLVAYSNINSTFGGAADQLWLTFNGDSAADYQFAWNSAGTDSYSTSNASANYIYLYSPSGQGSGNYADTATTTIANYSNTSFNKSVTSIASSFQTNSHFYTETGAGWWLSTSAITSLTFSLDVGDFSAGSTISLYGIP